MPTIIPIPKPIPIPMPPVEIPMTFGTKLKSVRETNSKTITDCATAAKISAEQWQAIEDDKARIKFILLWDLATAIGCSVSDFFS